MSHVFRKRALARKLACAAGLSMFFTTATLAQQPADHSQHGGTQTDHSKMDHAPQAPMHGMDHGTEKKKPAKKKAAPKQSSMPGMDHDKKPGVQGHSGMTQGDMQMKGFLGPYAATREGSGTSWLPDATPHEGLHGKAGDWMTMIHGQVNLVYDHQGGPRGGTKTFVPGMLMGMAQKETADGAIGLRAMISPDPFMGASGYPLLFATGESANGRDHLVDRQHPHDLFMELAATYRKDLSANSSVFVYGGLPGEPALGPPAFMHRTSGMDIPEAPITHHWLDSTHITFGVVTAGLIIDNWKLEGSAFRGREPDQ
jgi:hypothetical protein